MSSKSHMQELQLEKEKVNEVRVNETFDNNVTQTARQKKIIMLLKKGQLLKAVKTIIGPHIFLALNPFPRFNVYVVFVFRLFFISDGGDAGTTTKRTSM